MPVDNRDGDILEHILRCCVQVETTHEEMYKNGR